MTWVHDVMTPSERWSPERKQAIEVLIEQGRTHASEYEVLATMAVLSDDGWRRGIYELAESVDDVRRLKGLVR